MEPTEPEPKTSKKKQRLHLERQTRKAIRLRDAAQHEQALALQRELLEQWLELVGPEDSAVLHAKAGIASTLLALGKLEEARQLFEQALETWTRTRGPDSRQTLKATSDLAVALTALGQLSQARQMFEQVLDAQREQAEPADKNVLHTQTHLAEVLRRSGELDAAKQMFELAVQGWTERKATVQMHWVEVMRTKLHTLGARHGLARVQVALGELEAAKATYETILQKRTKKLKPTHPLTLQTALELAQLYRDVGELEAARSLAEQTLENQRQLHSEEHPDVQTTRELLDALGAAPDPA